MSSQSQIDSLREHLKEFGSCVVSDRENRKMFFVLSSVLDVKENGILIAYEGEGAMFFTLDRPLNVYRLLSAGFSPTVATMLAALVNDLTEMTKAAGGGNETPTLMLPYEPTGKTKETR